MRRLAAALAVCMPVAASAQVCVERADLANILDSQFGQSLVSTGLAPNGAQVQTWANPDTGTWTLVFETPTGVSRVMASGDGWAWYQPVRGEAL